MERSTDDKRLLFVAFHPTLQEKEMPKGKGYGKSKVSGTKGTNKAKAAQKAASKAVSKGRKK